MGQMQAQDYAIDLWRSEKQSHILEDLGLFTEFGSEETVFRNNSIQQATSRRKMFAFVALSTQFESPHCSVAVRHVAPITHFVVEMQQGWLIPNCWSSVLHSAVRQGVRNWDQWETQLDL